MPSRSVGLAVVLVLAIGGALLWTLARESGGEAFTSAPLAAESPRFDPDAGLEREAFATPLRTPAAASGTIAGVRQRVVVLVLDEAGSAISAAEVWASAGDRVEGLGRTDEEGALDAELSFPCELHAAADGFTADSAVFERPRDELRLTLTRTASPAAISGRLVGAFASGDAPTHVIAWPFGRELARADVRSIRAGATPNGGARTETSGDASFRIDGLEDGREYFVGAFRDGVWSTTPVRARAGSGHPVEVQPRGIYAARIEIADAGGGALRVSPRLFGRVFWKLDFPNVESLASAAPAVGLSGALVPRRSEPTYQRATFLYGSDLAVDTLGPISFEVQLPGYSTVRGNLWAPPAHEAEVQRFTSVPLAKGWGELELRWVHPALAERWPDVAERLAARPLDVGRVMLGTDDVDTYFDLSLPWTPREALTIRGVPAGRYQASFDARNTPWSVPGSGTHALVVEPGARASWEIDLSRTAALLLEFRRDGEPLGGEVAVRLLLKDRRSTVRNYVQVHGSPALVHPVRPSAYEVLVRRVGAESLSPRVGVDVELLADELTVARVEL